jgi:hypothetical protein
LTTSLQSSIVIDMKYKFKKSVIILLILILLVAYLGYKYQHPQEMVSPLPKGFMETQIQIIYAKDEAGDEIVDEISKVFKKEGTKMVGKAIACAYSESKLNPNAYNFNSNGTGDYSIFQVNSVHIPKYGDKFTHDWKENIRVAYDLYKKNGWKIWYGSFCK